MLVHPDVNTFFKDRALPRAPLRGCDDPNNLQCLAQEHTVLACSKDYSPAHLKLALSVFTLNLANCTRFGFLHPLSPCGATCVGQVVVALPGALW